MKTTLGLMAAFALTAVSTHALAEVVKPEDVKIEDMKVDTRLIDSEADPEEGARVFAARKLGNCLACHANSDMPNELFHGEVGPPLDGVGDRWSEAELRAIIVNSKAVFGEQTVMPGFYTLEVGADVRKDLIGETILSAEQVEDVVAYLTTLKE